MIILTDSMEPRMSDKHGLGFEGLSGTDCERLGLSIGNNISGLLCRIVHTYLHKILVAF